MAECFNRFDGLSQNLLELSQNLLELSQGLLEVKQGLLEVKQEIQNLRTEWEAWAYAEEETEETSGLPQGPSPQDMPLPFLEEEIVSEVLEEEIVSEEGMVWEEGAPEMRAWQEDAEIVEEMVRLGYQVASPEAWETLWRQCVPETPWHSVEVLRALMTEWNPSRQWALLPITSRAPYKDLLRGFNCVTALSLVGQVYFGPRGTEQNAEIWNLALESEDSLQPKGQKNQDLAEPLPLYRTDWLGGEYGRSSEPIGRGTLELRTPPSPLALPGRFKASLAVGFGRAYQGEILEVRCSCKTHSLFAGAVSPIAFPGGEVEDESLLGILTLVVGTVCWKALQKGWIPVSFYDTGEKAGDPGSITQALDIDAKSAQRWLAVWLFLPYGHDADYTALELAAQDFLGQILGDDAAIEFHLGFHCITYPSPA
jgi:hypothetical protein